MNVEKDTSIDVKQALDFARKSNQPSAPVKDTSINLDQYSHGDVIEVNGVAGIVIDREKKLRDIAENDEELQLMRTLMDPNDPTFATLDPAFNKPPELQEVMDRYLNEHPETKMKRAEVQKTFSGWSLGWEPGPDGMGRGCLVSSNDPRAKLYQEAIAKVQSGEVRLPTVEEYTKQEQEARKRYMEMANQQFAKYAESSQEYTEQEQGAAPVQEVAAPATKSITTTEMEEMNMSAEERAKAIQSAKADPMMTAIAAQQSKKEEDGTPVEQTQGADNTGAEIPVEATAEVSKEQSAPPIDLFQAKEQLDAATQTQRAPAPTTELPIVKEEAPSVVINIPENKADSFMAELKPRTEAAIQTAKKIKVNFTKELDLPKATKRITDIDGYRSVAPKNVSADLVPRILINSGYIGYFKACGALKWSRLAPAYNRETETFEDMDQAKVIQFCYEQLVTTSIGNLSYRQFLENTSVEDLESMLHAIMGASLPDEQEVVLTCGNCGNEFDTTYSIAELPDYDDMAEETSEQATRIQAAKDMIEDAKDVHDESPVMLVCPYEASSTGSIFIFKHSDLSTVVDRQNVSRYLAERYGTSAALLSVVIVEVRIKTGNAGTDADWSVSNDPTVICEELLRLSKENLDDMKAVVDEIPMLPSITYSFSGVRTCPKCEQELTNLRQRMADLVFQVALKAQYFV